MIQSNLNFTEYNATDFTKTLTEPLTGHIDSSMPYKSYETENEMMFQIHESPKVRKVGKGSNYRGSSPICFICYYDLPECVKKNYYNKNTKKNLKINKNHRRKHNIKQPGIDFQRKYIKT